MKIVGTGFLSSEGILHAKQLKERLAGVLALVERAVNLCHFLFGNVCKDPAFVPQYFNTDLKARQKLVNQALKHKGEPFALTNEYASEEVKAKLKNDIDEVGASELDAYRNANNVGCAAIYDGLYRITSAAPHSTPRVMGEYVTEAPDGTVLEVRRHPQLGDVAFRLHDIGTFLLNVRIAFEELFQLRPSPEVSALRDAFAAVDLPE